MVFEFWDTFYIYHLFDLCSALHNVWRRIGVNFDLLTKSRMQTKRMKGPCASDNSSEINWVIKMLSGMGKEDFNSSFALEMDSQDL